LVPSVADEAMAEAPQNFRPPRHCGSCARPSDFSPGEDERQKARMRVYKGRDEEKPLIASLALHASELTLKHPETKEPFTIAAPLPHEFEVALKYLRKFSVGGRAAHSV